MNMKLVETFVCLFEEGNITRASLRLNIVQPAVSMQLRKLEELLHVSLFDRTNRGISPTASGKELYATFAPVLADIRAAQQKAFELGGKTIGQVFAGLNPSITNSVLAGVLREYAAKYPDVDVHVDEDTSDTLVDRVNLGVLDLAFITYMGGKDGLTFTDLVQEDLVLVRRRQKGRTVKPMPLSRFRELDLILPRIRQGYRQLLDQATDALGFRVRPYLEINSAGPTFEIVAESNATAIMPKIIARKAQRVFPIDLIPIVNPRLSRRISAVHREKMKLSPIHKAFISTVKNQLETALGE